MRLQLKSGDTQPSGGFLRISVNTECFFGQFLSGRQAVCKSVNTRQLFVAAEQYLTALEYDTLLVFQLL